MRLACALALLLGACALEEPDETKPVVLLGWPPAGATVPSGEDVRVVAGARDEGANLSRLRVELGTGGGCFVEVAVSSTGRELASIEHVFTSCRPTGSVEVRAFAWDDAGWSGEHGPVAITVEP